MESTNKIINEQLEKRLKIIGYAKLQYLTRRTVDDLFKGLFEYLIKQERYEECAIIKRKKEDYEKYLNEINETKT